MKKILTFSFWLLLQLILLINGSQVFAQETSFDLTNIGSTDTADKTFNAWTYYGENPVFKGTAPASQGVSIQIDQESFSATADETGSWTWQPTTLTEGSYSVVLSSGEANKSFTLNIQPNQVTKSSTVSGSSSTSSAATLPQSGSAGTTLYLVITGVTLVGLGMMMSVQPALSKKN